tara:strand:+ start:299 stop:697 length:399 start_codon:yes stop_codon:yes gene_type:complete
MDGFIEYDGVKDMKDLFEDVLGSKVSIKDDLENTEEQVFNTFINKLRLQTQTEDQIQDISGLEISKVTDNLWYMVENLLKFVYGEEATEVIMWYVLLRDEDSEYWEENEEAYKINNLKSLWKFVKKKLDKDA